MLRADAAILFGLCLALAPPSPSSPTAGEPVRVFMVDGSFVQAKAMPELEDDHVVFRLHPSGMLARLPLDRVDVDATFRAAEPVTEAAAPAVSTRNRGTVSGGSGSPVVQTIPQHEAPVLELQHPREQALEQRYALEFTRLSERQEALEQAADALRARETELDRELRRYLYQPKLAGALASKLREVQEQLERREAELQQVVTEIQMLLNSAAARGLPVRRLPPGRGGLS